jgi:transglutaminase-like putative cysteine protease
MMEHRANHHHNRASRMAFQAGVALLLLRLLPVCPGNRLAAAESGYTRPRHIEYSVTVQNTTNHTIDQAHLWTYVPVALTATQQRVQLGATLPFQEIVDAFGNSILAFTLHDLRPSATKILTIRVDLLFSETPVPEPVLQTSRLRESVPQSARLQCYLHPELSCESDDAAIVQLANRLKSENTNETAETIFQWVADNIEYAGYLKQPRGARYALEYKQGDCTECMYLFVALCRAAGIPARGLGGYVISKNAILKASEYHNWAEFYIDGIWHIADPQRGVFMEQQSSYLVMQILRGDRSMRRFWSDDEGLEITMN